RRLAPSAACALVARPAPGFSHPERRRLLYHLPDDFEQRSPAQQVEILAWVRRTFRSEDSDYRRRQATATAGAYGIRFPEHQGWKTSPRATTGRRLRAGTRPAPVALSNEMGDLLAFKTATFAAPDRPRASVWSAATADLRIEHLGLFFGAVAGDPQGPVGGLGAPLEALTFALMLFPAVIDDYLEWRSRRRGFLTVWEVDLLICIAGLVHPQTGWLAQTPALAARLQPIPHLVRADEIAAVRGDWAAACARIAAFAEMRSKEVKRICRRHHDPFEPIVVVLEADRPLSVYRRIADEIRARRPDARHHRRAAAENARAYLMFRFALHLGFRQRTLRELQVCPRGRPPTPAPELDAARRGELRWSERLAGWEVVAPPSAFKNAASSYFQGRQYQLRLPDVAGLYDEIDAYLAVHRRVLLGGVKDPGTFFVKQVKAGRANAAMNDTDFYSAWRALIERYGVYNPYTGRGAIAGLLPHGPHCARHVLATHVLKQTGSFEQAGFAIQDNARAVEQYYGRFLPREKAARSAQLLDPVWAEGAPDS
ncbi:hypothetical protein, partial [Phenylobacterium sp.]|uniref:hypothetical protein n=1 Tax=Phenylobacterium sp. TaxID=1871053 RepID=UPI002F3F10BB